MDFTKNNEMDILNYVTGEVRVLAQRTAKLEDFRVPLQNMELCCHCYFF